MSPIKSQRLSYWLNKERPNILNLLEIHFPINKIHRSLARFIKKERDQTQIINFIDNRTDVTMNYMDI